MNGALKPKLSRQRFKLRPQSSVSDEVKCGTQPLITAVLYCAYCSVDPLFMGKPCHAQYVEAVMGILNICFVRKPFDFIIAVKVPSGKSSFTQLRQDLQKRIHASVGAGGNAVEFMI